MLSSLVSEGEFIEVIPKISAFSFIRGCVGDAAVVSLLLECMLMRGGTLLFSALMGFVGSTNNAVCFVLNLNKVLILLPEEEH